VIDLFERRFSVDETVRRHKPAPEAYHSVASALKVDPGDICLIASHVWDTIGAGAAGWQTALILREGTPRWTSGRSRTTSGSRRTRTGTPAASWLYDREAGEPGSHAKGPLPAIRHESGPIGGSGANERLTWTANRRHASGANRSTGPLRSVVSRTRTSSASATSTQLPPLPPL
jgi:hypothetical protein